MSFNCLNIKDPPHPFFQSVMKCGHSLTNSNMCSMCSKCNLISLKGNLVRSNLLLPLLVLLLLLTITCNSLVFCVHEQSGTTILSQVHLDRKWRTDAGSWWGGICLQGTLTTPTTFTIHNHPSLLHSPHTIETNIYNR